jgi:hypothetical protein
MDTRGATTMRRTQLTVFIENRPGRLLSLLQSLANVGIDIEATCVTDSGDFGLVRLIVSDPERALELLKREGRVVSRTEVLCASVPDQPGGLVDTVLQRLADAGVNIQYLYDVSRRRTDRALVVLKPDDLDRAAAILGSEER